MRNADVDGSGSIDYEEFLAATVHMGLLEQGEALMHAFQHLDRVSGQAAAAGGAGSRSSLAVLGWRKDK